MEEAQTRKEDRELQKQKLKKLKVNMERSLSELSKTNGGLQVLRLILHESGFLAPLTHETALGVNKDLMMCNEAKRGMYLALRKHMDRETILRVELPENQNEGEIQWIS